MMLLVFLNLWFILLSGLTLSHPVPLKEQCPQYERWAKQSDGKELSEGRYQLPFQRPSEDCRTFYSQEVEDAIERLRLKIADSDLFRLFENAYPNTLDTAVKWKGYAWKDGEQGVLTDEDLAFVITGDMYAPTSFYCRSDTDSILEMRCGYATQPIKFSPTCQSSKHRTIPTPWLRFFAASSMYSLGTSKSLPIAMPSSHHRSRVSALKATALTA